jgi:hypothetical protein
MKPMTGRQVKLFVSDGQLQKRLSKLIVQQCFRNTEIEKLHAAGKISQEEMKHVMVDAVNQTYTNLTMLLSSTDIADRVIQMLKQCDLVSEWNEPVLEPPKSVLQKTR